MKRRYDAALAALKEQGNSVKCNNSTEVDGSRIAEDIGRELERLLQGEGEAALRSLSPLLKRLTVYGDGHAELTLQGLDTVFFFR